MFPCSPFPPLPAPAASAIVARFRVSTEMGDPWDRSWWTGGGEESMVGEPGLEGWLAKAGGLGAELPTSW